MPIFAGTIRESGAGIAKFHLAPTHPAIVENEKWPSVEPGTVNVKLNDYVTYTHERKVDYLVPHTETGRWDCYFQRCKIRRPGDTQEIAAVIATTGDNFWGIGGNIRRDDGTEVPIINPQSVESMSNVHICKALDLKPGDPVEIVLP
jgi:hypothetical protein